MDYLIAIGVLLLIFWVFRLQGKVNEMSATGDAIKAAVDKLRTSIEALVTRLKNNPTEAELAGIATDLGAAADSLDALDRDVEGGPIEGDGPIG